MDHGVFENSKNTIGRTFHTIKAPTTVYELIFPYQVTAEFQLTESAKHSSMNMTVIFAI